MTDEERKLLRQALKAIGLGLSVTIYVVGGIALMDWLLDGIGVVAFVLFSLATLAAFLLIALKEEEHD